MKTLQKLKATLLLAAGLCLLWTQSYAQKDDGLVPSPEGQSTINRIQNPVNYYTGTVNIQAPLCSVPARGASVAVSLNYTASAGVKVDDNATCVGLGWNLSAGGKITRIVKGLPDEKTRWIEPIKLTPAGKEFMPRFLQGWSNWVHDNVKDLGYDLFFHVQDTIQNHNLFMANLAPGLYNPYLDTEADIFYFEIPGAAGIFVFDHDLKAYTLSYQDIKIEFAGDHKTNQNYFTITDNSGNTYKFGTTADSREITATKKYVDSGDHRTLKEDMRYNTAWLLDQIIPFNGETVTFSYKPSPFTPVIEQSSSYYAGKYDNDPGLEITGFDCYTLHYNYYPKYIDQITWSKGKIIFSYGSMTDLINKEYTLLTGINIFERNNEIRNLHLDYSAYSTNSNDYSGPRLDAVWEQFGTDARQDIYKFRYYGEIYKLPTRGSRIQDHWGYFNEREEHVSQLPYIDDGNIKVNGHRKNPSLLHARANMLQSIHSASGERIQYSYELNEVYHEGTASDQPFGGLRIKQISTYFRLPSPEKVIRYEYKKANGTSSGKAFQENYLYHDGEKVFSKCVSHVWDLSGRNVFYSRVTEYQPNGSKTVYNFDENIECADPPYDPARDIYPNDLGDDRLVRLMSPHTSYFWRRGLLTSKETYKASKLIMKENYSYSFGKPIKTIECYTPQFIRANRARINIYKLICEPVILTKTSKTVNAYGPVSETSFTYDSEHISQPTLIKTSDSEGNLYETRIKYPFNYTNISNATITDREGMVAAIKYMLGENAVNLPIETIKYKNGKIISGSVNYYKALNLGVTPSGVLPARKMSLHLTEPVQERDFTQSRIYNMPSTSQFQVDSRYKTDIYYDEYDAERKLLSSHEENGISESVVSGYDGTLLVAKISNAVHSTDPAKNQVIYNGFESGANILKLTHSKSGEYVLNGYYSIPLNTLKPGKYAVSYWRKPRTSSSRADWEYVESIINITSTTPQFTLSASSTYIYDELRIMPVNAQMTTYSYRPGVGKISETDVNGITVYYEYNKYGLLKAIKDNDGRVVKKIVYDNYTSNL